MGVERDVEVGMPSPEEEWVRREDVGIVVTARAEDNIEAAGGPRGASPPAGDVNEQNASSPGDYTVKPDGDLTAVHNPRPQLGLELPVQSDISQSSTAGCLRGGGGRRSPNPSSWSERASDIVAVHGNGRLVEAPAAREPDSVTCVSCLLGQKLDAKKDEARSTKHEEDEARRRHGAHTRQSHTRKMASKVRGKGCFLRCQACTFAVIEYKVCGFRLRKFFPLCGAVMLSTTDAWLDWALVRKWFLSGDVNWFHIGLSINLVSGLISAAILAKNFQSKAKPEPQPEPESEPEHRRFRELYNVAMALICCLLGVAGLAPMAFGFFILYSEDESGNGTQLLKYLKIAELIFEALPQSILQYVPLLRPISKKISNLHRLARADNVSLGCRAGRTLALPTAGSSRPHPSSATCSRRPSPSHCSAPAFPSSALSR
eukprot:COSAG04_NODE_201_length_20457_cov_316.186462_4_plen_430_part_00